MPQALPTAQRALQVFEVFAREGRPLTNSELARCLDLADSSCSDLLFTLREAGYLVRMPKSRSFYPTTRLQDVLQRIAAMDPMHAFAARALERLTALTGESSLCGHLEGSRVKIFACQESPRALRYVLRPGSTVAVHATALGKALLGAMPGTERESLIAGLAMEPVTSATPTDRDALRDEIRTGAGRGWFTARDEGAEGVAAVGVGGEVNGRLTSICVVGPTHRIDRHVERYADVLLQVKRETF